MTDEICEDCMIPGDRSLRELLIIVAFGERNWEEIPDTARSVVLATKKRLGRELKPTDEAKRSP